MLVGHRAKVWLVHSRPQSIGFDHKFAFDGVFSVAGPTPVFHQLRGPTDEELADIVEAVAVANTVIETLRNDGYLSQEGVEIDRPD